MPPVLVFSPITLLAGRASEKRRLLMRCTAWRRPWSPGWATPQVGWWLPAVERTLTRRLRRDMADDAWRQPTSRAAVAPRHGPIGRAVATLAGSPDQGSAPGRGR